MTSLQRSRRLPRLDPSCILNVVFYSPGISIHPGTSGSADSTIHLGTADSADSTLHFSIAYRAESTLHLCIAYRVDSHNSTYCVYSHDPAYCADSVDTAYMLSTVTRLSFRPNLFSVGDNLPNSLPTCATLVPTCRAYEANRKEVLKGQQRATSKEV